MDSYLKMQAQVENFLSFLSTPASRRKNVIELLLKEVERECYREKIHGDIFKFNRFVHAYRRTFIELELMHHTLKPTSRVIEGTQRTLSLFEKAGKKDCSVVDLHTHPDFFSVCTDRGFGEGMNTTDEMFGRAVVLGLEAVGITPHYRMFDVKNTIRRISLMNTLMEDKCADYGVTYKPVVPVVGMEFKTSGSKLYKAGHVLVHFFNVDEENADFIEQLSRDLRKERASLEDLLRVRDYFNYDERTSYMEMNSKLSPGGDGGAFATITIPHYKIKLGIGERSVERLTCAYHKLVSEYEPDRKLIDAIEAINTGSCFFAERSDGHWKYARHLDCAPLGSSDAHRIEELGLGYTVIENSGLNIKKYKPEKVGEYQMKIFNAIKEKRTHAFYVPMPFLDNPASLLNYQILDKAKRVTAYNLLKLPFLRWNPPVFKRPKKIKMFKIFKKPKKEFMKENPYY